jgi:hypothetical protein
MVMENSHGAETRSTTATTTTSGGGSVYIGSCGIRTESTRDPSLSRLFLIQFIQIIIKNGALVSTTPFFSVPFF